MGTPVGVASGGLPAPAVPLAASPREVGKRAPAPAATSVATATAASAAGPPTDATTGLASAVAGGLSSLMSLSDDASADEVVPGAMVDLDEWSLGHEWAVPVSRTRRASAGLVTVDSLLGSAGEVRCPWYWGSVRVGV